MAVVDLIMPKLGESIMEATILKWLKQPGDTVKQDETVLEIATDKVDSEIPSTVEGVIEQILFNVNDVVPIGTVIAKVRTHVSETVNTNNHQPEQPIVVAEKNQEVVENNIQHAIASSNGQIAMLTNGNKFYSPLVLNIAGNENVSMSELENIPGTGNDGRVTKRDILEYVRTRKTGTNNVSVAMPQQEKAITASLPEIAIIPTAPPPFVAPTVYGNNVEIIEMDRMRKLIAKHMVDSKHTSPHVTSFTEADVTHLVMWREKMKKEFEKRENTKITFTPLFIEAIIKCLKKYPLLNSSLDGDRIIIKKEINIGMATALPSGNLIVPVIKNADQLNLVGLTKQVNALADNARNNKLKPDDTQGGTFTFTNVGTFGSLMGTPIINQPQVAILAVGNIKKRPVVIETDHGDTIGIRHMMYLSMSYDHRIIDGALGATFLSAVAAELQHFNPERDF